MERLTSTPRPDWIKKVEELGLIYHHTQGGLYWNEGACYRFTAKEVDMLEAATQQLHDLCLAAGSYLLDHPDRLTTDFGIPAFAVPAIRSTWFDEPPALYHGRFDLIYDGVNPPKMLEYNADTPTCLIEAALVQFYWKEEVFPGTDQFNSLHERLVAKWKELKDYLESPVYFAATPEQQAEDALTATYLRDTAIEGGLETKALMMSDIGWRAATSEFVDLEDQPIKSIFKLYPWEWMLQEDFGSHAVETVARVNWLEPIWKLMWSNKALLAILWELNPNHPNLVPAYLDGPRDLTSYVKKPRLAREGANVTVVANGIETYKTPGDYGREGFVYQALIPPANARNPVLGSWIIDGAPGGMGIRESDSLVTDNLSQFLPHLFE